MNSTFTITKSALFNTSPQKVWQILTQPEYVKQYMFGSEIKSTWLQGEPITYTGVWEGETFEDKGTILQIIPEKVLKTTFFSPLSGLEDVPENYTIITYELLPQNNATKIVITQENNANEVAAQRAEANWDIILANMKKVAEAK